MGDGKARLNPFRTERLEALAYRFLDGGWDRLWTRLEDCGWRAAIVGPTGSGKTTLLHELAQRLPEHGLELRLLLAPRPGSAPSPTHFREQIGEVSKSDALLVDGAERLSFWAWRRLLAMSSTAGAFIVTQHREGRLPTLVRTRTTPALLAELISELIGEADARLDVVSLFARANGDLRAALLSLYGTYPRWCEPEAGGVEHRGRLW